MVKMVSDYPVVIDEATAFLDIDLGTFLLGLERFFCGRITPACAGERDCCDFGLLFIEDHPRVCGGKHMGLWR